MSNELMVFTPTDLMSFAEPVAKSNMLGTKSVDDVMAIMMLAQAENRHPGSVMQEYHIINGKPALKADAIVARFQRAGGTVRWTKYTEKVCEGVFSHPQGGGITLSWTIEQAKEAGLTKNSTWTKYPRAMLRSRVASEAIRTIFPSVLGGTYSIEETESFTAPAVSNQPVTTDFAVLEITQEQRTRVSDYATALNWTKEDFKAELGINSTKEITVDNWDDIKSKLNIVEGE
jgi:hypothetical protein